MKMVYVTMAFASTVLPAASAAGQDGGSTGAFHYSIDAASAATQKQVKAVVERYQAALNASDLDAITREFAPDAVAEWNGKKTVIGVAAMRAPYQALFSKTKFSTDFQFDAVDLHGELAIVRTHHPVGQAEVERQTGKKTLDINREIFVLKHIGDTWKIILYTFNAQPRQGEQ